MALNWPQKIVGETLDYTVNWAAAIGTDTLDSSTWSIQGSDSNLTTPNSSYGPKSATIWLAGGTANNTYAVINTITTAGGRIWVQAVNIKVVNAT